MTTACPDSLQPLVIVGCGQRKASSPTAAGRMYLGPYHRSCRQAAVALTAPDRILILSGSG